MVQIAGYQNLTDFFAGEEARDQGMRLSTRLTAAMLALVLVTAMVVGSLTYRNVAELALPRALVAPIPAPACSPSSSRPRFAVRAPTCLASVPPTPSSTS
jgi:hypothetical protein